MYHINYFGILNRGTSLEGQDRKYEKHSKNLAKNSASWLGMLVRNFTKSGHSHRKLRVGINFGNLTISIRQSDLTRKDWCGNMEEQGENI